MSALSAAFLHHRNQLRVCGVYGDDLGFDLAWDACRYLAEKLICETCK